MSLYYEADPADENTPPQLPPLLRAEAVTSGDVQAKAVARAAAGEVGLVCYAPSGSLLDFAVTLAPEVDASTAAQMHHALMVAVGDAIGALAPPEVVVSYQFPGTILFNRGIAGSIQLVQGPLSADQVSPAWMVVSARVRLSDETHAMPLEFRMANTSLEEEGAGFISRTRFLEACCRHFLVWLHKWEDEGFRPVHDMWTNRIEKNVELRTTDGQVADWLGLDETGSGLIKLDGEATSVSVLNAAEMFITPQLDPAPHNMGSDETGPDNSGSGTK